MATMICRILIMAAILVMKMLGYVTHISIHCMHVDIESTCKNRKLQSNKSYESQSAHGGNHISFRPPWQESDIGYYSGANSGRLPDSHEQKEITAAAIKTFINANLNYS
jgi:hypothetical protein